MYPFIYYLTYILSNVLHAISPNLTLLHYILNLPQDISSVNTWLVHEPDPIILVSCRHSGCFCLKIMDESKCLFLTGIDRKFFVYFDFLKKSTIHDTYWYIVLLLWAEIDWKMYVFVIVKCSHVVILVTIHCFITGQLKEKKGRWKIFKRWKTRYFTLSGNNITYNKKNVRFYIINFSQSKEFLWLNHIFCFLMLNSKVSEISKSQLT